MGGGGSGPQRAGANVETGPVPWALSRTRGEAAFHSADGKDVEGGEEGMADALK